MKNLTVRVDEETLGEIERVAKADRVDRSTVARDLLKIGIRETRKKRALELYRKGKCTLWRAAQLADVPLREMIELVTEDKAPMHITPEDVDEAWREAFEE